jgi:acyl-coenzyme A synthetase/AMP-(fatty) acid ligase
VLRLRISQQPWLRAILVRRRHVSRAGFNDVCRLRSTGAEPERNPGAAGDDVDPRPVLLLHSSGSTGQPKVIQYTRGSLNTFLCWQGLLFRAFADRYANDQEALLSPRIVSLPLAHFGGLSFCLQALLEGRTVHLLRQHSPHDCLALALRSRCQLLLLVPTLYELLLEVAGHSATASSLRYCLTMGEPLAPQLGARIRHALGAEVFSAYGMSEGLSGIGHAADGQQAPPGSCGRLLFGSAKLLDAEGRESAEQGELWVRNATTRPCYLDAQMNARNFREGWYRTGDRFMRDTQGWYYYLGRVDAMCFVNGRNVYPRDVEAVLLQHPLVADCIAAPLVLHNGRQRPAVLVRTKAGTSVTAQELMDHCLAFGALHVAPAWLTFCRQLPLTATGKHDRQSAARLLEQDYRQQQRLAC